MFEEPEKTVSISFDAAVKITRDKTGRAHINIEKIPTERFEELVRAFDLERFQADNVEWVFLRSERLVSLFKERK